MRVLLVIALVSLVARPVFAQVQSLKPAAKAKLDKGMKLAGEKNYDQAIKELRAGYVMSEAREFLYAMGQVERLRGNCRAALVQYQSFLDSSPSSEQVSATKLQMDRCEAELKPAEAKVEPRPAPVEPAPVAVATPDPKPAPPVIAPEPARPAAPVAVISPAPAPWYKDTLGNVLLISGAAVAVAGGATFVVGNVVTTNSRQSLDSYTAARELSWAQPVGLGLLGLGGAAIIGSVIRYATAGSGNAAPSTTVGFAPSSQGGQFVLSGSF